MFEPLNTKAVQKGLGTPASIRNVSIGTPGDGLALKYSELAGDGAAGPRAREAAVLFSAAESSLAAGDGQDALSKVEQALPIFREVGDAAGIVDSLRILVCAHALTGDREEAIKISRKELEGFKEKGDRRGEAAMLLSEAEVASGQANTVGVQESDAAIQAAIDARDIFRSLGDQKMEAASLVVLSTAFPRGRSRPHLVTECKRSLAAGEEALAFCRRIHDKRGQAKALHAMGVACVQQEEEMILDALQYANQAMEIWKDLEDRKSEALELHSVAQMYLQDNKADEAAQNAQAALTILQEEQVGGEHQAATLSTLVFALIRKKEYDEASRLAERKVAHFQSDEDPLSEALAYDSLFSIHLAQEDFTEALRAGDRALQAVRSVPNRPRRARQLEAGILQSIADVQVADKQSDKAEENMEEAVRIFKEIDDADGLIRAHCALCYVSMSMGEWRDAIRAASDSRDVARLEEDRLQEGVALLALCCAMCGKGDTRRAPNVAKDAQQLFNEEEHKRGEACAWYLLANVYISAFDYDKAVVAAKNSQNLYRSAGIREDECNLSLLSAHISFYKALEEGIPDKGTKPSEPWLKALKMAEDALALNKKAGTEAQIGKTLLGVAQVHVMTKNTQECVQLLDEAIELAQRTGNLSAEAYALTLNAQMYWALHEEDRCQEPAEKARELFRTIGDVQGEELADEMTRLTKGGTVVEAAAAAATGESIAAEGEYDGPTEEMLLATVNEVAFSLIGNESLAGDTPLMDAGLDSLASVEFQNTLAKEFTGVQLPSTLVFDYPTPKTISEFIYAGLTGKS